MQVVPTLERHANHISGPQAIKSSATVKSCEGKVETECCDSK